MKWVRRKTERNRWFGTDKYHRNMCHHQGCTKWSIRTTPTPKDGIFPATTTPRLLPSRLWTERKWALPTEIWFVQWWYGLSIDSLPSRHETESSETSTSRMREWVLNSEFSVSSLRTAVEVQSWPASEADPRSARNWKWKREMIRKGIFYLQRSFYTPERSFLDRCQSENQFASMLTLDQIIVMWQAEDVDSLLDHQIIRGKGRLESKKERSTIENSQNVRGHKCSKSMVILRGLWHHTWHWRLMRLRETRQVADFIGHVVYDNHMHWQSNSLAHMALHDVASFRDISGEVDLLWVISSERRTK